MTKRKYTKSVDGRDVRVYLSEADINKAALLGGGNVSKGIRISIAAHYASLYGADPDNDGDDAPDDDPAPNPKPTPAPMPTPKPASPRRSPEFVSSLDELEPLDEFKDLGTFTEADLAEMRAEQARAAARTVTEADFNAGRVQFLPANT